MSPELYKKKVVSVGNYIFTGNTLGKGNFARVEEAVHTILNVKVAIKIIDINHIKEDYVIKNLYREAKIMAKLNHPCIVSLFQTMQRSDNVYYLVTEAANGGDLCAFVKKQAHGKLGEKQTKIYGKQFSSALCHMHNLKVVHRDLKMENVMLNSIQTQIKIVDFGLSNFWSSDNPLRTHCGSPEYAAPELFITGKKYGAEVDLWSFGIILYGMVLGHLPFVTSRSQELPSQERRKQLVAQINKGLSSGHRRALSSFSPEFRSLICKLLVADSSKRMTTKELIVHPWITDKGKRIICSNPLKILDNYEKNKILAKIGTVLQVDPKVVSSTVLQDNFGKVGGIYNILRRRYQLNQIQGDGSSKAMPSLTIFELSNLTNSLEKKLNLNNANEQRLKHLQNAYQKPQSAQTQTKKSDYTPKLTVSEGRRLKPNLIEGQLKIKSVKSKKKFIETSKVDRPNTVQVLPNQKKMYQTTENSVRPFTVEAVVKQKSAPIDYRSIRSPSLRRKVYSASITNKVNSSVVKHTDKKSPRLTRFTEKEMDQVPLKRTQDFYLSHMQTVTKDRNSASKAMIKAIRNETSSSDKFIERKTSLSKEKHRELKQREMSDEFKLKENESSYKTVHKQSCDINTVRKQLEISKPKTIVRNNPSFNLVNPETAFHTPEVIPENVRSKSEETTRRRPVTGPLYQILETSLKTAVTGCNTINQKFSKTYAETSGPLSNFRRKKISPKKDESWERSHMAYGDFAKHVATPPSSHHRKVAIYDPIAKSIADYVTNNVSNKIYRYPWLKK